MRWIPDLVAAASDESVAGSAVGPTATKNAAAANTRTKTNTVQMKPKKAVPHCGCSVKPWENCEHTLARSLLTSMESSNELQRAAELGASIA